MAVAFSEASDKIFSGGADNDVRYNIWSKLAIVDSQLGFLADASEIITLIPFSKRSCGSHLCI